MRDNSPSRRFFSSKSFVLKCSVFIGKYYQLSHCISSHIWINKRCKSYFWFCNQNCILIDTAGIRKKKNVDEDLEFYSVIRSMRAIDESDVCMVMVDATLGMEQQDLLILRHVEQKKKGLVILVNKWDLVEKETNTMKKMEEELKDWPIDPVELASQMAVANASGDVTSKTSSQNGNTPTPAGGAGKKPLKDKRQGQVTKETK